MSQNTDMPRVDQVDRGAKSTSGDPGDETMERAAATLEQLASLQRALDSSDDTSSALGRLGEHPRQRNDTLRFELPAEFLLSVVVPVFNERRTINRVVASLFALPLPLEVIVVDDGSTDGTCAMLTRLNHEYPDLNVLFEEKNKGKGAALRRGFSVATGTHVVVQDADLEYDPRDIPSLVEPLAKDEADAVFGSRFLESRWKGSSLVHRWGNRLLTQASNWMTGWQLTDMETCYKVFRRELLQDMQLEQNGFGFEVELTAKLAKQNARVVERPISYNARSWKEGKKIGWRDGFQALYCICQYR